MKIPAFLRPLFVLPMLLSSVPHSHAEEAAADTKTLSPYFIVLSESAEEEQLPLQGTSVDTHITGIIADVRITQTYQNRGKSPIEAVYVFPASTRAAVYDMKMTVGDRLIQAKVKEKKQAKAEYQQAKKEGKTASLLEQQRPNVFQMKVGNILPGDNITVELSYTETLVPTDSIYEFMFPTVVGPRYSNRAASKAAPSEQWVSNPYLREGTPLPTTFDISTTITSGLKIKDVASSTHKVAINYDTPNQASVKLDPIERNGGNRDYVVRFRLADDAIDSGLQLFQGKDENFFLLTMEPPARIVESAIVPREYIFVVDVSGSMSGFPIETAKGLMRELAAGLKPSDRFNLVLFAGASAVLSPTSLPVNSSTLQQGLTFLDKQQGGGGTELLAALRTALAIPSDENFSRSVVVITDGYVDVEREAYDLVKRSLGKANLFSFGIGSSVNRHIIEALAKAGMGEPFFVLSAAESAARAHQFREYIDSPVLSNISISYDGFEAYDMEPGAIPDLFARRPVMQFGKWRGSPEGKITIRGRRGSEEFTKSIDVNAVKPDPAQSGLRYLWARHRIATLDDFGMINDPEIQAEVTTLGITYNLLTRHTSFIAVDQVVRAKNPALTVKQPLPLPQGVSDLAVAEANVPGVPEPETWMLLAIVMLLGTGIVVANRQDRLIAVRK